MTKEQQRQEAGAGSSQGTEGTEHGRPRWRSPRANNGVYALAAFAVLSFIGGLFIVQPLIFVSVPLMAFLVFKVLRSDDPRPQVDVERTLEKVRLREGEGCRVRLRVRNIADREVAMLQIRDHVPSDLTGRYRVQSAFSVHLGPREVKDVYYEVYGRSFGVYRLGPISLRAQDPSGLFESEAELDLHSRLAVFPETTEMVRSVGIRPRKTRTWPGEIAARRAGAGMDYYGIRRMQPSDPLKRVNWRASARVTGADSSFSVGGGGGGGGLLVNEYVAEMGTDVLLVVDPGRATSSSAGRATVTAHTIRAAISLAERLLRDRNRVGLVTTGVRPARVAAGYGRRQFDRIALSLIELEPGDSDIQWWVDCSIHLFFPNIPQVIFISPLIEESSRATVAELARNGDRDVIVVSPDPVGLTNEPAAKRVGSREREIATKLARMERTVEIDVLRSANVIVIDWLGSESLDAVMEAHRVVLTRYAALSARNQR